MPWDNFDSSVIPSQTASILYDGQKTEGDEKISKYGTGKPYRIFITGDIKSDSN